MNDTASGNPVNILLVEDNHGDARLTTEALRYGKVCNKLDRVENGIEAMRYLRREGEFKSAPRPDLILLDLNLPKMNGREVLAEIRAEKALKTIPVVILTTSRAEQDIQHTYELKANCYVTKPVDFVEFMKAIRSIENFWMRIVALPPVTQE